MKKSLIENIRLQLRGRFDRLTKAARDAHLAATDADSKAESKYDTRNLEASYLAVGQARQVEELAEAMRMFDGLSLPRFSDAEEIDAGALVELQMAAGSSWFLLVPAAGGLEVEDGGREITLLSPESPLYQRLLGLAVGDEIEQPPARVMHVS